MSKGKPLGEVGNMKGAFYLFWFVVGMLASFVTFTCLQMIFGFSSNDDFDEEKEALPTDLLFTQATSTTPQNINRLPDCSDRGSNLGESLHNASK